MLSLFSGGGKSTRPFVSKCFSAESIAAACKVSQHLSCSFSYNSICGLLRS
jgi:hypothetical protein